MQVTKLKGYGQNVILTNEDTGVSLNLGRITMKMLDILKEDGYTTEDKTLETAEEWNLKVSVEVATELSKLAMPMKKPIRDQRKKPEEKTARPTPGGDVDIFNLIYGNVD